MTSLQMSALEARELRRACVHEAAHLAMLQCMGGAGQARVWRNADENADHRSWLGNMQFLALPGSLKLPKAGRPDDVVYFRPLKRSQVYIGMAGLVAELVEFGEGDGKDAGLVCDQFFDEAESGSLSETDAAMIGEASGPRDVITTHRLLVRCWQIVQREADWLQTHATTND